MQHDSQHPPTFVLVGHCGPDAFMLRAAVERSVPGASVVTANDAGTLDAHRDGNHALLINRVLDGSFHARSGIELIRTLREESPGLPLVLISNHDDAQREAEAAGATPGFGKADLYEPATQSLLRDLAANMQEISLESNS